MDMHSLLPAARVTRHIRLHHQRLLMKALSVHPGASQAELIEDSGLSRPTVGAILDTLCAQGYVVRDRSERARRGAPVGHYFLNAQEIRFLGVDIGPAGSFGQWIDINGRRLSSREWGQPGLLVPTQAVQVDPDDTVSGGTIAVPAMFDPKSQQLERSTVVPELVPSRLRERFAAAYQAPFHYVHNAAAAALAEQSISHEPFVVFVLLRTSIGVGYADSEGPAGLGPHHGEIAHLPIDPAGPVCTVCGRRGCLESWVGIKALAHVLEVALTIGREDDRAILAEVRERLQSLDGRWPPALHGALEALATAAEILTQVVGEVPLVLGGPIGELLLTGVRERIKQHPAWLSPRLRPPRTVLPESFRVAYGAALAARDQWLDTFAIEMGSEQEQL